MEELHKGVMAMTKSDIAKEMRQYLGGRGTIRAKELAVFLGEGNLTRVREKYLNGLEAIDGRIYLVTEVAERLKERCKMK